MEDKFTCEHCNREFDIEDVNQANSVEVCDDCLSDYYFFCEKCNEYHLHNYQGNSGYNYKEVEGLFYCI